MKGGNVNFKQLKEKGASACTGISKIPTVKSLSKI
jgi:hypothetical protein